MNFELIHLQQNLFNSGKVNEAFPFIRRIGKMA